MYGESGALIRTELAALLRQHRIQQRLGGTASGRNTAMKPADVRERDGLVIRQYRQTIIGWCAQAASEAKPLAFSATMPASANPFRRASASSTPLTQLAHWLAYLTEHSSAPRATLDLLTATSPNPVVEHWRHAARAAALAEHDTGGLELTGRLTAAQAQALAGDVAIITQALIVLDRRYRNTPGWEPLPQAERLGWAALATALDVSLGQPDYTIDQTGWQPRIKPLRGPVRPGVLGVLQAEHNLLVHLGSFPSAMNLRLIVDSQRLLSARLVSYAARIDEERTVEWRARADTYALIQRQLRDIAGHIGRGEPAVVEAANAAARLKVLPPTTVVEPRVLAAFQTLFDRIDTRIADIVEAGIHGGFYLQRVALPRGVDATQSIPLRERFEPTSLPGLPLLETVRADLRPRINDSIRATPGRSRAELHAAILHRPPGHSNDQIGPTLTP